MKRIPALLVVACLSILLTSRAWPDLLEVREVHYQMGTLLDITIWHADPEEAKKILRRSVQEVHRLDRILSNYKNESAVSMFNNKAGHGKTEIDKELFQLLDKAFDLSVRTGGYFDVTVGPLMELWREAGERGRRPDPEMMARARSLVGYGKLKLFGISEAALAREGMSVDLGGIGKGYAVDRVVEILKKAGVKNALVNFGGSSIYALGSPLGRDGWTIATKGTGGKLLGALRLKNQALATSGSMGRSWTVSGEKYGHIINPKTGLPVKTARIVTAVARTATAAEALTKPFILLGGKAVIYLEQFPDAEVLVASEGDEIWLSAGFASLASFRQAQAP